MNGVYTVLQSKDGDNYVFHILLICPETYQQITGGYICYNSVTEDYYEVVNDSINETELNNGWTEMNLNKYDE